MGFILLNESQESNLPLDWAERILILLDIDILFFLRDRINLNFQGIVINIFLFSIPR